jgi:hypothetical protein
MCTRNRNRLPACHVTATELSLGWLAALVAGMLIDAAGAATAALAVAGLFAVVAVVSQLAQSLRQLDADQP